MHWSDFSQNCLFVKKENTAWKVSKYGLISGPHFPAFRLNAEKYAPEITPYLDTFHAVKGNVSCFQVIFMNLL